MSKGREPEQELGKSISQGSLSWTIFPSLSHCTHHAKSWVKRIWLTDLRSLVHPCLPWSNKFLEGTSLAFIVGNENSLTNAYEGEIIFEKENRILLEEGKILGGWLQDKRSQKCKVVVLQLFSSSLARNPALHTCGGRRLGRGSMCFPKGCFHDLFVSSIMASAYTHTYNRKSRL